MKMRRIVGYLGFGVIAFIGGAAANLLTSTPTAMAADPPGFAKRIVTKQLVIVDDKGKMRIALTVKNKLPLLSLYDEKGRGRLGLALDADGVPGIVLFDRKRMPRLLVSVENDNPSIQFNSKDAKTITMLLSTQTLDKIGETTTLKMINAKAGKVGAALICTAEGGGALGLFDKDGKQVWGAP